MHLTPHWHQVQRRNEERLFPRFLCGADPSFAEFAVSREIVSAGPMSCLSSCFATSRLFAAVLIRCAETAVYVLFPCFGSLLNFAVTGQYFRPKRVMFLMCLGSLPVSDELVGALVDVKLLLRACCYLTVVRLCPLHQNHVERTHHAVCNFASLWSRFPALD